MDDDNNNGSFIPIEELPRYNINTNMSLHIFGVFIKVYFNRQGMSLSRREMKYEFVRYITFYDFPRSHRDIRDFVEAGFYYSQDRDFVVCYCCGYRRGNWMAADVPSDIHQRVSPNCIFFHANYTVNIPYHIVLERYGSFFPSFTSLNEQNRSGPSPVSERFSRGEEHLFREHGVRPEINEEVETFETIPLANLPMRQDVLATTSHLLSSLGVQVRRLDSVSTLQESDNLAGMHMERTVFWQTSVVLHNHLMNRVDYTNYSGPSVTGYLDDYQRNLRNYSMNQEDGTFATTCSREQVEEEHDYTRDVEPVRKVQGTQINDSQENETDETERKAIYQPETNRKSEFVINGRKENISLKLIQAQYLTKPANDASILQVELSNGYMHHSNISPFENNTDVVTMSSEVNASDLDSTKSICDQRIGQTSAVNGQLDIPVSGGKEECSSSDISVSTTSNSRELANVSREIQHSRNSADKEMTSGHLRCGFEPNQNNTSPVLSILSQNSQTNSNERLEGSFRSNAYQTDEEEAADNITTIEDAIGTEEDVTTDNRQIDHAEDMFDANAVNYKKQIGDNDSPEKENVIIDPGGSKTRTKKNCTTEDPEFYTSETPGPPVRDTSNTINVRIPYNMKECLSGMFIIHIGFEPNQNNTSPVSVILPQKGQSNSNERLEGSICSNAYQTDEEGAADNITTTEEAIGTDEDVTPDEDANSVNDKKQIGDTDNAGNGNVIIDPEYSQILAKKICTTEDRELYPSPTPEPSSDTIHLHVSCNSEECLSGTFIVVGFEPHQNSTSPVLDIQSQKSQPNSNERLEGSFRSNTYQTDEEGAGGSIATIEDATGTEEGDAGSDINNYFENTSSSELRRSDKTDITKAGEKHSEEKVTQRNQCIHTPESSPVIQDQSDEKSHFQPPAEQTNDETDVNGRTGTEVSFENEGTEQTQHPLLCMMDDSDQAHPNKKGDAGSDINNYFENTSSSELRRSDKTDITKAGEKHSEEKVTQRNQCIHTPESSPVIQDQSDEESHFQPLAEQTNDETNVNGRTGTEVSFENEGTEQTQHPLLCMMDDSEQAHPNKKADVRETMESSKDQQSSPKQESDDKVDIVESDIPPDENVTQRNLFLYATDLEQAGCYMIQGNSDQGSSHVQTPAEQEKDGTEVLLEIKSTEDIHQTVSYAANDSNQRNKSKEEEQKMESEAHLGANIDDMIKSFIDLGVGGQDVSNGGKGNTKGQNEPPDHTQVKTDSSCRTPSCRDVQHQINTSLPLKLGEGKVSTEHLKKWRSYNDVNTHTEKSAQITRKLVSQGTATKKGDKLRLLSPVIAQENGAKTCQETKAYQHSLLVSEEMSVSEGRNGTDGADEFNIDMRSHNEASFQSETDPAAETKLGENAANMADKRPDEGRHGRSIREDRVVPVSSGDERNSSTDMIASETPKTNGKTKAFLPVDALPNDTRRVSKENVESRKLQLPDNDEFSFAIYISGEMEKIKDPKRRHDVRMQCFKMIFEAQQEGHSIEKKQNECRSSLARTLKNRCSATEEE